MYQKATLSISTCQCNIGVGDDLSTLHMLMCKGCIYIVSVTEGYILLVMECNDKLVIHNRIVSLQFIILKIIITDSVCICRACIKDLKKIWLSLYPVTCVKFIYYMIFYA